MPKYSVKCRWLLGCVPGFLETRILDIETFAAEILLPGTGDRRILANLQGDEILYRSVSRGAPPAWRLYVNPPCVVVGKHQSMEREVNLETASRHGTPVFRRFTGGGTVYHDEGNLNFAVCEKIRGESPRILSYDRYTAWLAGLLEEWRLESRSAGNRVEVGGRKISGLAARVGKSAVLVHGTLLVSSDLSLLRDHLRLPARQVAGLHPPKGPHVVSHPFPETTLASELGTSIAMEKVLEMAGRFLESHFGFGEWSR